MAAVREARQAAGVSIEDLERRLILGPGWVSRFEAGDHALSLDMLLALLAEIGVDAPRFFSELDLPASPARVSREFHAEPVGRRLLLRFNYGKHDALFNLGTATIEQFERVLKILRDGLAESIDSHGESQAAKANAVATAFLAAVTEWPNTNPSDLWWFVIYRAYCDPYNHPADFASADLGQSWKRTAGWALEEVLVRWYRPALQTRGILPIIEHGPRKQELLDQLTVSGRLEADKVDVLLTGTISGQEVCFGVVHVKASFAERRTDDVPLSRSLVEAGYTSPLWTMDCKSTPSASPVNKGELGRALENDGDRRSAKRKDIEDDGYFSACFSYNRNTIPTPPNQDVRARVVVCDFKSPEDEFYQFIVAEWERFRTRSAAAGSH